MTYHGTDIRGEWQNRKKFWEKADLVTVSTRDLLKGAPENVKYTPNPVDTELFTRKNPAIPKSALFMDFTRYEKNKDVPRTKAEELTSKEKLSLTVWERDNWGHFPNETFPRFIELFDNFIDTAASPGSDREIWVNSFAFKFISGFFCFARLIST